MPTDPTLKEVERLRLANDPVFDCHIRLAVGHLGPVGYEDEDLYDMDFKSRFGMLALALATAQDIETYSKVLLTIEDWLRSLTLRFPEDTRFAELLEKHIIDKRRTRTMAAKLLLRDYGVQVQ